MSKSFPHGMCECTDGCQTCNGRHAGPAAYEVVRRDGRRLKVCTRCNFSHDKESRLLVTPEDDLTPYGEWDSLGLFCIEGQLSKGATS